MLPGRKTDLRGKFVAFVFPAGAENGAGAAQTQLCQSIIAMSGPRKHLYIMSIWQKVNAVARDKRLRAD